MAAGLRLRFVKWHDNKNRERDHVTISGKTQKYRSTEGELF
jgi:hypothetical protein